MVRELDRANNHFENKLNVIPHLGLSIYDQLIRNKIQNITEGLTALAIIRWNKFEELQESSAKTFPSLCLKNGYFLHENNKIIVHIVLWTKLSIHLKIILLSNKVFFTHLLLHDHFLL